MICVYCKKPCDASRHDWYGESVLHREMIVCEECDEYFAHEDGPWNEVH